MTYADNINKCIAIIGKHAPGFKPKIGIILGSGLSSIAEQMQNVAIIDYKELPGFYVTEIQGQAKKLYLGFLQGVPVACLAGRSHYYEGPDRARDSLLTIIRTLKKIGCEMLFTANAAGSLNPESGPGNLMVIKDHINFLFHNPMVGPNDEEFGERFFSMENAYDLELRTSLLHLAKKLSIPITEGIYLATLGPSLETPAEIKAFKILGADAVAMSTVPETIIARHCGLRVISLCTISNLAAGLSKEPLTHENTLKGAALGLKHLTKLLLAFVTTLT